MRAQAIAEPLGALDVLSDALTAQGSSVANTGGEWAEYLRRALDVALSAGLEYEAGRAFANLYSCMPTIGDSPRRSGTSLMASPTARSTMLGSFAAFLQGERAAALERTGRWDEAVALSTELLASADLSPLYRLRPLQVLGVIRARRGQPDAWGYLDEAAAAADASG